VSKNAGLFTVIIPARYASTRLPGKPLADIGGKPMVVRVAERARLSQAARVVVAADSQAIVDACATRPGGATVVAGYDPKLVEAARAVVASAAIADDHPELVRARELGLPVISRKRALADLVSGGLTVAVAGTHSRDRRRLLVATGGLRGQLGRGLVRQRLDRHHLGPVLPVAVGDEEQDRRAERASVADAGDDLGPVGLDLLPGAAAVAALASREVGYEVGLGPGKARGHALEGYTECPAVGLARRKEAKRPGPALP